MSKSICVVGTGYVGLIASVGLADFGNTVVGVDIDKKKIDMLNSGVSPIYENGIEGYLKKNLENERLSFTSDVDKAIKESEIVFIAVGTPSKADGDTDLSFISAVINIIAKNLNDYKVIVTKSTVPVGTNRWIKGELNRKCSEYNTGKNGFDIVSNPEFLREGRAIQDFFHPDRTVIGYETERAKDIMVHIYRALNLISVPFVFCSIETAELIKYASNAYLAVKITYINEIAELCEKVGADVHAVAKTMGMDGRIGSKFLHPGPGYGGSCFPKDTRAMALTGKKYGARLTLVNTVIDSNEYQKSRNVAKLKELVGDFKGKTVGVLGLAFKQETDDVRESPSINLVEELLKSGARVQAHDPKAMDNFEKMFPEVVYCRSSYDAVKSCDAIVLMTEWNEYRSLDLARIASAMNGRIILDSRNLLSPDEAKEAGFKYLGVGRV